MNLNRFILAGVIIGSAAASASATLRINEVMQSNIDCLMVDKELPDSWVELYNEGSEPVNLKGWGLSVKDSFGKAYIFPDDAVIDPGSYLVVYCDKKDTGLHTSFRVDSGKGLLILWKPDGTEAHNLSLAKMAAPDVSCGLSDSGAWVQFVTPTPGTANTSAYSTQVLPQPVITPDGGLCSGTVNLSVTMPEDAELPTDARLCVTTDGREPTISDAVDSNSFTASITTSTVVRAKILSASALPVRSAVKSYIFHPRELNMPLISLVTDPDYLYDEQIGILSGQGDNANWLNDWRRPLNVEYYDTEGNMIINQLGNTRVQGGATRTNPQKSMAVYANKRFGEKRFNSSDFWPDKPEVKKVKSFILRNSGNDYLGAHISDVYAQWMLGSHLDNIDWQAYRPVVVYLNGKYHGLLDLRERSNDDYVEANYDGLEDIDMIENFDELKAGDASSLFDLLDLMGAADTSLQQVAELLDIDNFSSNFALALYSCFSDWLNNNSVFWRNNLEGADNHWRVITKDLDHSMGKYGELPSKNHFAYFKDYATTGYKNISNLYTFWLRNAEARKIVTDKISFYVGDFLNPDYAVATFKRMTSEIAPEMFDTYGVNNTPGNQAYYYNYWQQSIGDDERYITFISQRPNYIFSQIKDEFGYGDIIDLEVQRAGYDAAINGMKFTQPDFVTKYFRGLEMTLSGVEGKSWKVDVTKASGSADSQVFATGPVNYTIPADASKVVFSLTEATGIDSIYDDAALPAVYFTLDGIRLSQEPTEPGVYICRRGSHSEKIIVK